MAKRNPFFLLLWKNYILQKRRPIATSVELILPLVFAALLVIIRTQVEPVEYKSTTVWDDFKVNYLPPFEKSALPDDGTFYLGYTPKEKFVEDAIGKAIHLLNKAPKYRFEEKCNVSVQFLNLMSTLMSNVNNVPGRNLQNNTVPLPANIPFGSGTPSLFSAMNSLRNFDINKTMECMAESLKEDYSGNIPIPSNSSSMNGTMNNESMEFNNITFLISMMKVIPRIKAQGFDNEESFIKFLENDTNLNQFIGGVIFTKHGNDNIQYTLRLHSDPINVKKSDIPAFSPLADTWKTHQLFPLFTKPGPREKTDKYGGKPGYYNEGFLSIMHAINRGLLLTKLNDSEESQPDISLNRFPFPPYIDDSFLEAIQGMLPLLVLLSFFYTAMTIVRSIVHEKETKMKEYMMMMGLSNWMHWTAWFLKYLIFMTISCVFITILYKIQTPQGAVLTYSDGTVIFVYLVCFASATISFCFMLSVFFSKANVGAAAGGVLFGLSYMPYLFIVSRYEQMTWSEKAVSSLLSNVAMANGVQVLSMFESQGVGVQWSNIAQGVTVDDSFTFLNIILFLLLDTVLYGIITWYIEAVFPGEYGIPKKWYFLFQRSYWLGVHKSPMKKQVLVDAEAESINSDTEALTHARNNEDQEYFESYSQNLTKLVEIIDLKKEYKSGGKKKLAVDGLSLNMYEGQITVLLGHNGAGKTSTMSILTGLFPPSQGFASIMGHDIATDMKGARKSMGMCPQHDILFDQLTVDEHLYFFSCLKGFSHDEANKECDKMTETLQLTDKRDKLSKTLSGGMKRKLSVGIALSANSKFIVLDEPTSGMDPSARRAIWDVLQLYRSQCSMLISTHFMDEADLLGDRIAIMAHGKLRCSGSSVFLKNKFGVGYHVILIVEPNCDVESIKELFQSCIPEARIERIAGSEVSYLLPFNCSHLFPDLFDQIENRKHTLGIQSFGATITTMEEVFLRVTEDVESTVKKISERRFSHTGLTPEHKPKLTEDGNQSDDVVNPKAALKTGFALWIQQFYALLVKKIIHSKRNYKVIIAQLLIPVLFVVIAVINATNAPFLEKNKKIGLTLLGYGPDTIVNYIDESPDNVTCDGVSCDYKKQFKAVATVFNVPSKFDNMSHYLAQKFESEGGGFNSRNIISGEFKGNAVGEKIVAWFNGQGYHTTANTLLYVDQAYMQWTLNNDNISLDVSNFPLPRNESMKVQEQLVGSISGFMISFNLVLGFSFVMASFSLFLVRERVDKARLLQRLAGVDPLCFWLSTFLWDMINFIIPCILTIIVFVIAGMNEFIHDGHIWITFLILFLFCWSSLPISYLLSFLFTVPSTALVTITIVADVLGVVTVITINILRLLQEDEAVKILDWIFLLVPHYSLGQGLGDLYTNDKMVKICTEEEMKYFCEVLGIQYQTNFLAWEAYGVGRFVTFMLWEGLVFFLLVLAIDYDMHGMIQKHFKKLIQRSQSQTSPQELSENEGNLILSTDSDVAAEEKRITETPLADLQLSDLLFINKLRKQYENKFVAVKKLSAGIKEGECFGLLGINGAGKTTTFKMLTGDIKPSSGSAYLAGYDIFGSTKQAQQYMGYCPQFDALISQMTGKETLIMYARLRGIPPDAIPNAVTHLSKLLNLDMYMDRQCGTYSGGNKRKLSTAIALIGGPPVVLLDEPSTGMDPGTRRLLWDAIKAVCTGGRCVIITSHNMEECEALCTRLAIMVNGEFKCLGGPQHLKNKFGDGYSVEIKMNVDSNDTEQVKNFFSDNFPYSLIKDEHQGILAYHVPSSLPSGEVLSLSMIFRRMETAKEKLNIDDYSVSQTTLEQVFLGFAKRQKEASESNA